MYHLLEKRDITVNFFSLKVEVNKCKPSSMNRPPQYNCILKPPLKIHNSIFNKLEIKRVADNSITHVIDPGEFACFYEIPYDALHINQNKKSCGKVPAQRSVNAKYIDDLKLNKYVFQFKDDGFVPYATEPEYLYSKTRTYEFDLQENNDDETIDINIKLEFETYPLNVVVYSPYMLINKTEQILYFGEKHRKYDNVELIDKHQLTFFNPCSKQTKFRIKTD